MILLIAVGKYAVEQFIAGVNYWAFLPLLVAQAIQFQRKDFNFLKLAHIHKYWPYAFIYFFMCAITFIAFGFNSLWYQLLLSVLICIALPAVNIKGTSIDPLFVNFGNFLKPTSFEWRTGLRQYGLAVVLLLLAGLGLSYFKGGVPVIIFFLTLNTSVFYLFGESKELLVANYNSPRQMIFNKIKNHLAVFFALIAPLSALYLFFNIELWYVLLYVWIIAFLASVNAILFKYASYLPGARFDNNNVLQALMLMFFLIPFLFPIPIIMMIINYKKSIVNLKPYFYNGNQ